MRRFEAACAISAGAEQFSADVGGEFVVLSLTTGTYYGLAEVASRIWEMILEGTTVGEIEERLLAEFDAEPERCRADLQGFLGELASRGMIDIVGPAPAD